MNEDPQFYTPLGAMVCAAISLVLSAAPSRKGSVSKGQGDVASYAPFIDGAAVRASALVRAGASESRPALRQELIEGREIQ